MVTAKRNQFHEKFIAQLSPFTSEYDSTEGPEIWICWNKCMVNPAYGKNMVAKLEEQRVEAEAVGLGAVKAVPVQVQHYRVPLTQCLHLHTTQVAVYVVRYIIPCRYRYSTQQ